jgi:hypothetical protein
MSDYNPFDFSIGFLNFYDRSKYFSSQHNRDVRLPVGNSWDQGIKKSLP